MRERSPTSILSTKQQVGDGVAKGVRVVAGMVLSGFCRDKGLTPSLELAGLPNATAAGCLHQYRR